MAFRAGGRASIWFRMHVYFTQVDSCNGSLLGKFHLLYSILAVLQIAANLITACSCFFISTENCHCLKPYRGVTFLLLALLQYHVA